MLADLKRAVARGEIVIVLGTGVTASTTFSDPVTTWTGLIRSGLQRIASLGLRDEGWVDLQERQLSAGDLIDLLGVAQQVENRLRRQGELSNWLEECFGSLQLNNPALYAAIDRIKAPIATTNYDLLAENALRRGSRHWAEVFDVASWLRMKHEARPIFHLHGVYTDARTVVLGHTSYQILGSNEYAQFVQKVLATTHSFLFIGCGAGLEDPNLGQLIDWIRANGDATGRRHYRLCRNSELADIRREMEAGSRVFPIGYGSDYADLATFIAGSLAHPSKVNPPEIVGLATAYEGLTDIAYADEARWKRKDVIFGRMVDYAKDNRLDVDALLNAGNLGLKTAAIAYMSVHLTEEHAKIIAILARDVDVTPNQAYKIGDFVHAYVDAGIKTHEDVKKELRRSLAILERSFIGDLALVRHLRQKFAMTDGL